MSNRIKSLQVLHLFSETFDSKPLFEDLILGLQKMGGNHTVCFLSGKLNPKMKIIAHGIKVITCDHPAGSIRYFKPRLIGQLANILDSQNINLIHCQRHKSTVYGTLAACLCRHQVHVVTTVHGADRTRHFRRRFLNWILYQKVARIFAVSDAIRNDVISANWLSDHSKVIRIYNGIQSEKFRLSISRETARQQLNFPSHGEILLGTIGRLVPVKGHEYLIKAFAQLLLETERDNLRLVIVGEGRCDFELQQLVNDMNITDKVLFLGFRDDIPLILRALDVFVFPSLSEGLGLALIEAMSAELPIIATTVGGIPEVVGKTNHSLLVKPGNVDELVRAIKSMLARSSLERHDIGRRLSQFANENFSMIQMVSLTCNQYLSLSETS